MNDIWMIRIVIFVVPDKMVDSSNVLKKERKNSKQYSII